MKKLLLLAIALLGVSVRADFRDDVGYTQLKNEFGSKLPSIANVRLLQVEYIRNSNWAPWPLGDLSTKTFNYNVGRSVAPTLSSQYSDHANYVAQFLAGPTESMTPELMSWNASEAVAFTYPGNLNAGRTFSPISAFWDIENHSWGGNDALWSMEILAREDYRIERDNIVAIAGVDNAATMSQMIANGYDSIAVGVSSGAHPHTGTSMDTVGRCKPDLVAPADYTSYATPMVTSAAMILIAETNRTPTLAPARSPMVIKSLLLAGATKSQFPNWTHNPTHPLDSIYGAGQLSVYNTYKILIAGQQGPLVTAEVPVVGWDFNTTSKVSRRLYYFSVPAGKHMTLSAALAWYRHEVPTSTFSAWAPTLVNLDLKLWKSSNFALGQLLDVSSSAIDNVEHLYETTLAAGQYAIEVLAPADGEKYGLAWNGLLAAGDATPSSVAVVAPTIQSFGHGTTSAWSSATTPTTFTWSGTGATATLTDPRGVAQSVPASGSITITTASNGASWTLTEYSVDGSLKATANDLAHGQFAVSAPTPVPVVTPTPTPSPTPVPTPTPTPTPSVDQLRTNAAQSAGASYNASTQTYSVPVGKVSALSSALSSAGLQ